MAQDSRNRDSWEQAVSIASKATPKHPPPSLPGRCDVPLQIIPQMCFIEGTRRRWARGGSGGGCVPHRSADT